MQGQRGWGGHWLSPCFETYKERTIVGHNPASVWGPFPSSSFCFSVRLSPPFASVTLPYASSPPMSPTPPMPSLLPQPFTGPSRHRPLHFLFPPVSSQGGNDSQLSSPIFSLGPWHSVTSSLLSCVPQGSLTFQTWPKLRPSPGEGLSETV